MAFEGLIGQNELKNQLKRTVQSETVSHAYLFCGPEGSGKKSFAEEFAKMCMCTAPVNGEACGTCQSCTLMKYRNNGDCVHIGLTDGKNTVSVDAVRDEIREEILKAPNYSRRRVFIIEHAELMNEQAQNALLKTLEEPPEYVMLLLLCANTMNILDTIRSRTVSVELKRNTDEEILRKYGELKEEKERKGEPFSEVSPKFLCAYADGIMGRVSDVTENEEMMGIRKRIVPLLGPLLSGSTEARNGMSELIAVKEKKYSFPFFALLSFLRDAAVLARFGGKTEILNPDFHSELMEIGRTHGYYRLKDAIATVDECYKNLLKNAMAELAVEDMLIKIGEKQ